MVIDVLTRNGAQVTGGSASSYKKKREAATVIHSGDVRFEVGKKYLYIDQKLTNETLYSGFIPPTQKKFEDLMDWLGVRI